MVLCQGLVQNNNETADRISKFIYFFQLLGDILYL